MRALVLAAGRGSRLAPLTDDRPKCLVELAGASLLGHQFATLHSQNITNIAVVVGHRGECVAALGLHTIFNPDYESSNMVYTLFCARDLMAGDTDLVIAYGDIVYEAQVLRALMDCGSPICVAVDREWRRYWELRMADPLSDAETMKIDQRGMIVELGKKPRGYHEIQGQYIGLIKVRRDYVASLLRLYDGMDHDGTYDGKSHKEMYMTSFIQHAIDTGWPVRSVPISNGWLEVDTYAELQLYRRMHQEGTLADFCRLGDAANGGPPAAPSGVSN